MPALRGSQNPAWRGGHVEYKGENWPEQRRKARARDKDTCQRCGFQAKNLPVHHMRPFRLFDTYLNANLLENLATLCPSCHGKTEVEFWKAHPEIAPVGRFPAIFVERTCRICGVPYLANAARTETCDSCSTFTCDQCGAKFVNHRHKRTVRFCSRACNYAFKRAHAQRYRERICPCCGKSFTDTKKTTTYCSQACHVKHDPPDQYRQVVLRRKLAAQESDQT